MLLLMSIAQAATISWEVAGTNVVTDDIAVCPDGTTYAISATDSLLRKLNGNAASGTLSIGSTSTAWQAGNITCGGQAGSAFHRLSVKNGGFISMMGIYPGTQPATSLSSVTYSLPYYIGDIKGMDTEEITSLSIDGWGDRGTPYNNMYSTFGNLWQAREFAATQNPWGGQEIGFAANFPDYPTPATLWINAGGYLSDLHWERLDIDFVNTYIANNAKDMEALRTPEDDIYLIVLDQANNLWRGIVTL